MVEPRWKVVLQNNPQSTQILNKNSGDVLSVVNQGLDIICQAYAAVKVVCVGSPYGEVVNEGAMVAPQIPPALHQVMVLRWRVVLKGIKLSIRP